MPLYAGLDWSGSPFEDDERYLYAPSLVAVPDMEALETAFDRLRMTFHMADGAEFRGHKSSEQMQIAVLEAAEILEARFAVIVFDKRAAPPSQEKVMLPDPNRFPAQTAIAVLEMFLPTCSLARLWYDEGDINARQRQQTFHSAVQRLHRSCHPGMSLKVRPRPSHQSALIQLADIAGYGFSRMARGLVERAELRQRLEAIRADARHIVVGPRAWGE